MTVSGNLMLMIAVSSSIYYNCIYPKILYLLICKIFGKSDHLYIFKIQHSTFGLNQNRRIHLTKIQFMK